MESLFLKMKPLSKIKKIIYSKIAEMKVRAVAFSKLVLYVTKMYVIEEKETNVERISHKVYLVRL